MDVQPIWSRGKRPSSPDDPILRRRRVALGTAFLVRQVIYNYRVDNVERDFDYLDPANLLPSYAS